MTSKANAIQLPGALRVVDLRVEGRSNPIGIDEPEPRLTWSVAGDRPSIRIDQYEVQVADTASFAPSAIRWTERRRWTGGPVTYAGPPLASRQHAQWRVRVVDEQGTTSAWSATGSWEMGLLRPADWSAAWISYRELDDVSEPAEVLAWSAPIPLLRRRFELPGTPVAARLYVTSLGLHEVSINGHRVGAVRLDPGWTDYRRRVRYRTHDVTQLLTRGANVIGVALADGWYAGSVGWFGRWLYGDEPALRCQLEYTLADGSVGRIVSGRDWEGRRSGRLLADLLLGERVDGREAPTGWDRPGDAGHGWAAVSVRGGPNVPLVAARDEGVLVIEDLQPVAMERRTDGRLLVDFGQNIAGHVRLRAHAPTGSRVAIEHAEARTETGDPYLENLREADARDEYTFRGDGVELFEPAFTYHGFRYAVISGVDPESIDTIEARAISSATRIIGDFGCSDPLLEAIHRNTLWSLRDNFVSIPTDCPQRNERLGWTADIAIFAPSALFLADVSAFLEQWLVDLQDAQQPSGAFTDIAPLVGNLGSGNSGWADAGVLVPWAIYESTGDVRVLERSFDSMRRYFAYLATDHDGGLRLAGRYGDWVSLGRRTRKDLIGTAYLAHVAGLFGRIARIVGDGADAECAERLARTARGAFVDRFVRPDGVLNDETQTGYALALGFGLLPDSMTGGAADRLAALVRDAHAHLTTGFLGTPLVLPVLSAHGHHDLACRVARQRDFPSWGFEVEQGATTIWERWDGWTPERGFAGARMNSFNHYAFGSVVDWMHRDLAGLRPGLPGYRHVLVRPGPGGGITSASASHVSRFGRHAVAWSVEGSRMRIDVVVPPDTTAEVSTPDGGWTFASVDGQRTPQANRVELGSGTYAIEASR